MSDRVYPPDAMVGVRIFVQHQVCLSPPMSVAALRRLLDPLPEDADVEVLDGELLQIRWERHEEDNRG